MAETAPYVLDYFASPGNFSQEICEAVIANPNTPGDSIIKFVRNTSNGELLEVLTFNQQLLIKNPAIIDAVIANPHRTAEADRRAAEIKREFFEKERGAQQIANKLKAQGKTQCQSRLIICDFQFTICDFQNLIFGYKNSVILPVFIKDPAISVKV